MAVSSNAEPTPWKRRIVKQKTAKGMPWGTAEAAEKRTEETETMAMPQMYTHTWGVNGEWRR